MSDKRRPNANEYKLLERLATGEECCSKKHGPWRVYAVLTCDGPVRRVADNTVNRLRACKWVRQSYRPREKAHYLHLTYNGCKAHGAFVDVNRKL